jgi:hypothetical protein
MSRSLSQLLPPLFLILLWKWRKTMEILENPELKAGKAIVAVPLELWLRGSSIFASVSLC